MPLSRTDREHVKHLIDERIAETKEAVIFRDPMFVDAVKRVPCLNGLNSAVNVEDTPALQSWSFDKVCDGSMTINEFRISQGLKPLSPGPRIVEKGAFACSSPTCFKIRRWVVRLLWCGYLIFVGYLVCMVFHHAL